MTNERGRNLTQTYLPVGSVIVILIALFTFYSQISSSLDRKFAAMALAQEKFRGDIQFEVRIIREAILREHPAASLPQPKRN